MITKDNIAQVREELEKAITAYEQSLTAMHDDDEVSKYARAINAQNIAATQATICANKRMLLELDSIMEDQEALLAERRSFVAFHKSAVAHEERMIESFRTSNAVHEDIASALREIASAINTLAAATR